MREKLFERSAGAALAQHRDDRVVARDSAGDTRKRCLVDAPRHHVGGPRRRLDHGDRLDELHRKDKIAHQGSGAPIAAARPHQAELLDVARDRGLRRLHAPPRQCRRDLLLGVHAAVVDQRQDRAVTLGLCCRHPATFFIVSCARSICAAVMISGGTTRTEWSSTALTMRPDSRHASWNAFAFGSSNSNACIRPSPRTSFAPTPWIASRSGCSIWAAWPPRPSLSTTCRTASAATQASGLPPNVDPWSPGSNTSARGLARHAPIGTPPPRPLASVITSGVMPACWWANHRPVRPSPVWTSSRIRSRFCSSHHRRTAFR